jgi:hypothetical protein
LRFFEGQPLDKTHKISKIKKIRLLFNPIMMKKCIQSLAILGLVIFFAITVSWWICALVQSIPTPIALGFLGLILLALIIFELRQIYFMLHAYRTLRDSEQDCPMSKDKAYTAGWLLAPFIYAGMICAVDTGFITFGMMLIFAIIFSMIMCFLGKLVA